MSTLSDTRVVRGRDNSKMSAAERVRADGFWRNRLARAERKDRVYGAGR